MKKDIEIQLPKLGESIVSATVVQWFKKVGDKVARDEALLEVSTDKVNSEIPSPESGIVKALLVGENEEIEVGAPLAILSPLDKESVQTTVVPESQPTLMFSGTEESMENFFSPAVLQLARREKVSLEDLENIVGTGVGGRVTKKDVEQFVQQRRMPSGYPASIERPAPVFSGHEDKRIKMVGIRKAIADVMVRSHAEIPAASVIHEVDVTLLLKHISGKRELFLKETGVKLTVTSYLIMALSKALQKFPYLNAQVEGDDIVAKSQINVGFAVALEHEGLLVPVIKDCGKLSLEETAKRMVDLTQRARSGNLNHEEVKGGTVTLTNFGMTGALMGFPIIRPPEVAIVGIGAVQKRVIVSDGDTMSLRSMMYVTLTFDHRVVDGLYGCGFLNEFKRILEEDFA